MRVLYFTRNDEICALVLDNYPELHSDFNGKTKHLLNMLWIAETAKDFQVSRSEFNLDKQNIQVETILEFDTKEIAYAYFDDLADKFQKDFTWID